VQHYFYAWRDGGVLENTNFALLLQAREAAGRQPSPSAGVIDTIGQDHRERRCQEHIGRAAVRNAHPSDEEARFEMRPCSYPVVPFGKLVAPVAGSSGTLRRAGDGFSRRAISPCWLNENAPYGYAYGNNHHHSRQHTGSHVLQWPSEGKDRSRNQRDRVVCWPKIALHFALHRLVAMHL